MNRLWLGIVLMATLLAAGIWVGSYMNTTGTAISSTLYSAAAAALSGDWQAASGLAETARNQWDAAWHRIAAMADHAPMDEIDGLFAQLRRYQETGVIADFAAYCSRISQLITAVGEAHSFNWWNLL